LSFLLWTQEAGGWRWLEENPFTAALQEAVTTSYYRHTPYIPSKKANKFHQAASFAFLFLPSTLRHWPKSQKKRDQEDRERGGGGGGEGGNLQKRTITYEDETRETNPQPTSLVGRQQQTTRQTTSEGGDLFIFLFSRKANIAAHLQGFFLHPSEALGSSDFFSCQRFLALIRGFETLTHTYSPHTLGRIRVTQKNTAWDLDCASSLS